MMGSGPIDVAIEKKRSKSTDADSPRSDRTPEPEGQSAAARERAEYDMRKHIYFDFFCFLDQDLSGTIDIEEFINATRLTSSKDVDASEYLSRFDIDKNGSIDFDEFCKFCDHTFHKPEMGSEYAKSMITGVMENLKRNQEALAQLWKNYAASIDQFALRVIPLSYAIFLAYVTNLSAEDFTAWDSIVNYLLTIGGGSVFLLVVYVPWVLLILAFLVFHTITSRVQKNLQEGRSFLAGLSGPELLSPSREGQPGSSASLSWKVRYRTLL